MNTIINKIGGSLILFAALLFTACTEDSPKTDMSNVTPKPVPAPVLPTDFVKGADVSWVTKMENDKQSFYDKNDNAIDCFKLLRQECGANAIRLRVFVNPKDGWCGKDDVVLKALRAKNEGMRVMIDFHFSDSWADPGKQRIPLAWKGFTKEEIQQAIKDHVTEVLFTLIAQGVTPAWVQIGNETTNGMLYQSTDAWNDTEDNAWNYNFTTGVSGYYTNGSGSVFTGYVNAGYDAVKALLPDCKVIVHIDHSDYMGNFNKVFHALKNNNGRYDMIGISVYPEQEPSGGQSKKTWKKYTQDVIDNIAWAYNTFNKEVMIVEFGMPCDGEDADGNKRVDNASQSLRMLLDAASTADSHLKGIFYWEPQAEQSYNGYKEGCFKNGKPLLTF
ncbi:MAG: glycosyl hydrolase 53 family protein [Prevotella sp.]|nr:glycosyl hydrolase 53 family protein [Candidatus Prevotella equi]